MVLDKFYVKQMAHLREMMELEAAEMGLTIVRLDSQKENGCLTPIDQRRNYAKAGGHRR